MQVTQLMEKIEEMVAGSSGQHDEMDSDTWSLSRSITGLQELQAAPVRKAKSSELPLNMSGGHWSVSSSAYGSSGSITGPMTTTQGSMSSIASSGIGSLSSRAGSV
ncbi:hypothetical protein AALO_G00036000 [Alosa alosa]|uniref:Uncharacterized protein n=2 Tax=Alosa alosa TaxID=278164 RepID=A0AAV6H6C4_9TELE|nr:hypothetical protein AALO_G00036000 [Alosa alosa]